MTSKGPDNKKKAATPTPKSAPKKGKEKVAPASAEHKEPQQDKAPQQQQQQQQQQQPQASQQQSQPQAPQQHEGKRPKREKKEKETGLGYVKSVLSGDRLVIYVEGSKATGPTWRAPEEKEIKLSNLRAPLAALKNRDKAKQQAKREEEPWCWHSKDFLRKLAVGKRVEYQIDYVPTTQQGGRVYGTVRLLPVQGQTEKVDLSEEVVSNGWAAVPVKDDSNSQREDRKDNRPEHLKRLLELEEAAKAKQIGVWSKDSAEEHGHVRVHKPIKIRAPSEEDDSEGPFFDATRAYKELREQAVNGIVEHVHNGSMLRVLLLPSYREILLKISGVQSPMKRKQGDEPFAHQSHYITERNVLQRDVKVHLTAFEQQRKDDLRGEPTFYGEVIGNDGSIGEKLLEAGLAKFVEWSAPKEKVASLRALEEAAQRGRKGLWQYEQVQPSARVGQSKTPSSFLGRVIEVSSGGSFTVLNQGTVPPTPVTVTLSSINVPRLGHGERDDDFFAWDAREFVRKKILGKKVQVTQDYVRPAVTVEERKGQKGTKEGNEKKEEKVLPPKAFYTVAHEGKNIALGLVELGYATLLEHRGQDRSPHYDALFLAQERARTKKTGLHGNKDDFIRHRIHDLSRSTQAAKRLYKSLETKEGQKHKAIVEYVISGSRLKLCLPDHSCLITFFLAGARCPGIASRKQQDEGKQVDPLAAEGRDFTNALLLHHDVEVAIDGQDKTGAFRGHLWYKKKNNLALDLLAKGYAEFSGMGKNSASKELEAKYEELEEKAKDARLGIWKNYDPKAEEEKVEKEPEEVEAAVKPQKELISVTEILDGSHFYFHIQGEEHKRLEGLTEKLQAAGLEGQTPYPPERGDVVAVRFSDGQWYRALVQSVKSNDVHVFYGDYGNMDTVSTSVVRQLPTEFGLSQLRWQAVEGGLAYVQTRSPEDDWGQEAAITFRDLVWGKTMLATVEYRDKGVFYLLLAPSDNSALLVNSELCRLGLAKMPRRIPRNANETIIEFIKKDQEDAHTNHRGVFEYGDDDEEEESFADRRQGGRPGAGQRRGK